MIALVGVAQLAERWLVEPEVAGSSPVVHPKKHRKWSGTSGPFFVEVSRHAGASIPNSWQG